MELQLKNIGMIKEANVRIDGLTVIAGENDTGKSTVGKALYLQMKISFHQLKDEPLALSKTFYRFESLLFHNTLNTKDGLIKLVYENDSDETSVHASGVVTLSASPRAKSFEISPLVIESPLVWNLQELFRSSTDIESHLKLIGENVEIPYPFLMKDLYFKLVTKLEKVHELENLKDQLKNIMKGEFKKDEDGIVRFYRESDRYDLINVATGIKSFGIIQVLLDNNRLTENTILILDEPEVHLHPKWQLEMAKVIVELARNGVKIVVNSHSPYMIEALQRYSEREKVTSDFYLAENGYIHKIEDSNSQTLAQIFEKLSEPFDVFEEMESERFQNV